MVLYLLNSPVIALAFDDVSAVFRVEEIGASTARAVVRRNKVVSAIGHEATAKLLSVLLDYPVEVNRIAVYMKPNDKAIALQFRERMQFGKELSYDDVMKLYDEGKLRLLYIVRLR